MRPEPVRRPFSAAKPNPALAPPVAIADMLELEFSAQPASGEGFDSARLN